MINELTKEQEEYLPKFRDEVLLKATTGRIDQSELEKHIGDAYKLIGKEKPMLIILQSPLQAMMAIKSMKTFAKDMVGKNNDDQLSDQLSDQLRDQLSDQLWNQLWNQLRDQLRGQLRGQLRDQLSGQLGGHLWNQLSDQLRDQLRDQLSGQLGGQGIYDTNYLWGSHDMFWIAHYKFAEHIGVKYTEEQSKNLDLMYNISSQCEWWWPYDGICFVSEKPTTIRWDDRGLLHGEGVPSVEYEDGYNLYSWHGTSIPGDWVENDSITPETCLTWENMEQRRAACEIYGWDRVLDELETRVIDQDNDPEIGTLLEVELPDIGKEKFLRVKCGTGRGFALTVPPEMKTALEANAWTYGIEDYEYKPEVRT